MDGAISSGPVQLVAGKATFKTAALPVGTDTITVSYSGNANFTAGSASLKEKVNPAKKSSVATAVTTRVQDAALLAFLGESGHG